MCLETLPHHEGVRVGLQSVRLQKRRSEAEFRLTRSDRPNLKAEHPLVRLHKCAQKAEVKLARLERLHLLTRCQLVLLNYKRLESQANTAQWFIPVW